MNNTVNWHGYEFEVYPHETDWNEVAGLYIFAGLASGFQRNHLWHAFYVGQCQSFGKRLPNHENWLGAALLGATHVHVLVELEENKRASIEKALIEALQPALNVQLNRSFSHIP